MFDILKGIDYKGIIKNSLQTLLFAFLGVLVVGFDSVYDLLFKGDWLGCAANFG